MVVAAHLDLTGRPIPPGSALAGRRFLVENYDPIAALDYRRSGELSILWWLMSLRLVDEMAWYARDDLAPFGLMCLRMGWRAMSPITQRISRGLSHSFPQNLTRTLIRPRPASSSGPPARYRPGRAGRKSETAPTRQVDKVLL